MSGPEKCPFATKAKPYYSQLMENKLVPLLLKNPKNGCPYLKCFIKQMWNSCPIIWILSLNWAYSLDSLTFRLKNPKNACPWSNVRAYTKWSQSHLPICNYHFFTSFLNMFFHWTLCSFYPAAMVNSMTHLSNHFSKLYDIMILSQLTLLSTRLC